MQTGFGENEGLLGGGEVVEAILADAHHLTVAVQSVHRLHHAHFVTQRPSPTAARDQQREIGRRTTKRAGAHHTDAVEQGQRDHPDHVAAAPPSAPPPRSGIVSSKRFLSDVTSDVLVTAE
eukprot:3583720-Rhodomonas_salina.6